MPSLEAIPWPDQPMPYTSEEGPSESSPRQRETSKSKPPHQTGRRTKAPPIYHAIPSTTVYHHEEVQASFGEMYGPTYMGNLRIRVVDRTAFQNEYASGTTLRHDIVQAYKCLVEKNELWRTDPSPRDGRIPSDGELPWSPPVPVFVACITVCQHTREAVWAVGTRPASATPNSIAVNLVAAGRWRRGETAENGRDPGYAGGRSTVRKTRGGKTKSSARDATDYHEQAHRHLQLHLMPDWPWSMREAGRRRGGQEGDTALRQYITDTVASSLAVMSVRGWAVDTFYTVPPSSASRIREYSTDSYPLERPSCTASSYGEAEHNARRQTPLWHLHNAYEPPASFDGAGDRQRSAGVVPNYVPVTASVHTGVWCDSFSSVEERCYERPYLQKDGGGAAELTREQRARLGQWETAAAIIEAVGGICDVRRGNATLRMGHVIAPSRLPIGDAQHSKTAKMRIASRHELLTRLTELHRSVSDAVRVMRGRRAVLTRTQSLSVARDVTGQVFGHVREVRDHSNLVGYTFAHPPPELASVSTVPCAPAVLRFTNEAVASGQIQVLVSMFSVVTPGSEVAEKVVESLHERSPTEALTASLQCLTSLVTERRMNITWPWARLSALDTPMPPANTSQWPAVWSPRKVPLINSNMADSTLHGQVYRHVRARYPCTSRAARYMIKMAEAASSTHPRYADDLEYAAPSKSPRRGVCGEASNSSAIERPPMANAAERLAVTAAMVALLRFAATVDALYTYDLSKAPAAAEDLDYVLDKHSVLGVLRHAEWINFTKAVSRLLLVPTNADGALYWSEERFRRAQREIALLTADFGKVALSIDLFNAGRCNGLPALNTRRLRPVFR